MVIKINNHVLLSIKVKIIWGILKAEINLRGSLGAKCPISVWRQNFDLIFCFPPWQLNPSSIWHREAHFSISVIWPISKSPQPEAQERLRPEPPRRSTCTPLCWWYPPLSNTSLNTLWGKWRLAVHRISHGGWGWQLISPPGPGSCFSRPLVCSSRIFLIGWGISFRIPCSACWKGGSSWITQCAWSCCIFYRECFPGGCTQLWSSMRYQLEGSRLRIGCLRKRWGSLDWKTPLTRGMGM